MKLVGWIFTLIGGLGLIGALIGRDSTAYAADKLAKEISDVSNFFIGSFSAVKINIGFQTTVDMIFYTSVGLLILGIAFMIAGYSYRENIRIAEHKDSTTTLT